MTKRSWVVGWMMCVGLGCSDGPSTDAGVAADAAASDARPSDAPPPDALDRDATADATLDGGAPDAATDAALDDATTPDAGRPVTVEVHVGTTYVEPSGEVVELDDVSGWTVSAYAEGDPTAPATGVVAADGLLRVSGAPDARRVILLDTGRSPIAIVGTSTRIDLLSVFDGRSGPGPSVTTSVALDIHGITPWSSDDTLEVDSRASGFVWYGAQSYADPPIMDGVRSVSGLTLPWPTGYPLPGGLPGDDVFLTRYAYEAVGDADRFVITELAQVRDAQITDGTSTTLSATVAPVVNDLMLDVVMDGRAAPELDAGLPGTFVEGYATYQWLAGASRHGFYSSALDAVYEFGPASTEQRWALQVPRPPPAFDGQITFGATYYFFEDIPGATDSALLTYGIGTSADVAALGAAARLELGLSLPRDLTIGGRNAWSLQLTGVGSAPEIAWVAPATGRVRSYVVLIREFLVDAVGDLTTRTAGRLYTDEPHVTVPEGWLEAGHRYYLIVGASDTVDYSRTPFRVGVEETYATVASRAFTP